MRIITFSLFTTMLLLVLAQPLVCRAEGPNTPPKYEKPGPHIYETLDFPDLVDKGRDGRNVPLKVLYPKSGTGFPLVIMCHGGGGNRDANLYQARHLAGHGFVVICTEHVFSNTTIVKHYMSATGEGLKFSEALHRITKDPRAVLQRPRDVSFAIDQAVKWNRQHKKLKNKINTEKIAVMGHSFGAYTVLTACGARQRAGR